jgi:hypothetical protein
MREVLFGRVLPLAATELRVVCGRLGEWAGVVGGAIMVSDHLLTPEAIDRLITPA